MRFLILALMISFNASAAIKAVTYSVSTDAITGIGTIDITIPGSYAGLNPMASTWSGRQLVKLSAWFESRAAGDKVIQMYANDSDTVLSAPEQAIFASYPVLGSLVDVSVSSTNQGTVLPPSESFKIEFPNTNKSRFASGTHLIIVCKKAIAGVDTFTVNLAWDDGT